MKFNRVLSIIIATALLVLLVGPFLIPVPSLENTLPIDQLADADSHFLDVNGLQVHYKVYGKGEPAMILLHGFGASTYSWREVMKPLSELGTVIAYDRPAFGLTSRPQRGDWTGESPYSLTSQVELLVGLMNTLDIEKAILIGNSAGGTVATIMALQHPDRVSALVEVDAAIYNGGGAPDWVRPLLNLPQVNHLGPLISRWLMLQRGDNLIRMAWHDPSKVTPVILNGYRKPLQVEGWDRALWELTLASSESNLAEHLNEIMVPVLVVTGDDDRIVPTAKSLQLAGDIPGAQLVVIPSCGHLPHEECPEEFLRAVMTFISTHVSL